MDIYQYMKSKRIIKEEIDSFDWIRNHTPNLKDVIEGDLVEEGDKLTLSGEVENAIDKETREHTFIIELVKVGDKVVASEFDTNDGYDKWVLGLDEYDNGPYSFLELDGDLMVTNIVKNKMNESTDFDWIKEIEPETDLELGQLWLRTDGFTSLEDTFLGNEIAKSLNDVEHMGGGKLRLRLDGYCKLKNLFKDDSGGYSYVNQFLAEKILCEDISEYWEPYYNIVHDWGYEVWDLVEDNQEIYDYIVDHIIKDGGYEGEELHTSNDFDDPEHEGFRLDMLKDKSLMGELIENDDLFYELKTELTWSYEEAYNVGAKKNIWRATMESIEDLLGGKGEWFSYEVKDVHDGRKKIVQDLVFETSEIYNYISDYFESCFDGCKSWFNSDDYEYGDGEDEYESEERAFEDFCEECWELQYSDYIYFLADYLYENDEELNPSFDEYPSDEDIKKYFFESLTARI